MSVRRKWCRHHKGNVLHAECALGVDIEALVTDQVGAEKQGRHYMLPCHNGRLDGIAKATCDKCSLLTVDELRAADEEAQRAVAEFMERSRSLEPWTQSIRNRVRFNGKSMSGVSDCPICETSRALHWSCSAHNLHIHAKCTTDGCVSFME